MASASRSGSEGVRSADGAGEYRIFRNARVDAIAIGESEGVRAARGKVRVDRLPISETHPGLVRFSWHFSRRQ